MTVRSPVSHGSAFVVVALVALVGASVDVHAADGDPTLRRAEAAFSALEHDRKGAHLRARRLLSDVVDTFDDVGSSGDALTEALRSDNTKAWRGLPHERIALLIVLAALDLESGHPELALPALRNADLQHARSRLLADGDDNAAPLLSVALLTLRALADLGADDVTHSQHPRWQEAWRGLDAAYGAAPADTAPLPSLVAAVLDNNAVWRLEGRGPILVSSGAGASNAAFVAPDNDDDDGGGVTIAIGGRRRGAAVARDGEVRAGTAMVWSSLAMAQQQGRRAVADQLAGRAQQQQALQQQSRRLWDQGRAGSVQAVNTAKPTTIFGAALALVGSVGAAGAAAVIDPRMDTRVVTRLPESMGLSLPSTARHLRGDGGGGVAVGVGSEPGFGVDGSCLPVPVRH